MRKNKVYQSVGHCIYCGDAESKLSNEHILPFGLEGRQILPKSSCKSCATITGEIERQLQREMLWPLRLRLGMRSRHKKKQPNKTTTYIVNKDGKSEKVTLPRMDFPRAFPGFVLPPPGLMTSRSPEEDVQFKMVVIYPEEDIKVLKNKGRKKIGLAQIEINTFMRCMAKIAHSFACAVCEYEFEPLLIDFILGNSKKIPFNFVGGHYEPTPSAPEIHRLFTCYYELGNDQYFYVGVQLFSQAGLPTYGFLVGKLKEKVNFID